MRNVFWGLVLSVQLGSGPLATAEPATVHYGPFASTSPDSGTCGNFWANDAFDRVFQVHATPNLDGSYDVVEEFEHGTFVTVAGSSPGGCETNPGGTVAAGLTGTMRGSFDLVVTGVFDRTAECTVAMCGTTAGFVATVFGADATYTIPTFELNYNARRNGDWKNASADRGGNQGDVTGGP
jgi:hypothetical protein